nr:hypothetical protein CFP56_59323 [Quercus suber]
MEDPTTFLDNVVDNGRGNGMNGGDLREVKGKSASVDNGAWVGSDGLEQKWSQLALFGSFLNGLLKCTNTLVDWAAGQFKFLSPNGQRSNNSASRSCGDGSTDLGPDSECARANETKRRAEATSQSRGQ